jgi:hypothetical protein
MTPGTSALPETESSLGDDVSADANSHTLSATYTPVCIPTVDKDGV